MTSTEASPNPYSSNRTTLPFAVELIRVSYNLARDEAFLSVKLSVGYPECRCEVILASLTSEIRPDCDLRIPALARRSLAWMPDHRWHADRMRRATHLDQPFPPAIERSILGLSHLCRIQGGS